MDSPGGHIVRILQKSMLKEQLTDAESAELQQWKAASGYNEELWEQVTDPDLLGKELGHLYESDKDRLWEKVLQHRQPRTVPFRKWFRYAAAIVLIAGAATWLWVSQRPEQEVKTAQQFEVLPGSNKAVLTLSNGATVTLDSAGQQTFLQGRTNIQQHNGQLSYTSDGAEATVSYNTLTTPRGGQFMIRLPDGSRVWLNASSFLRYPTAFNGKDRAVELNGEAYFEVAPATAPFLVSAGGMRVEVLGTQFNVMAYPDERAVRTTLLEGAVRLSGSGSVTTIRPGEQGILDSNSNQLRVIPVNTEETIAWKDGYFWFTKADLPTVMRQISRWYDVEIVYQGQIPDRQLTGKFYRSYKLSQVLSILEANNIHFKTDHKKLVIMP